MVSISAYCKPSPSPLNLSAVAAFATFWMSLDRKVGVRQHSRIGEHNIERSAKHIRCGASDAPPNPCSSPFKFCGRPCAA
jgi:hypothetical protein